MAADLSGRYDVKILYKMGRPLTPLTALGSPAQDADLGTAGPTVLDLPGSTPSELVFIGGKQGIVYLLDR